MVHWELLNDLENGPTNLILATFIEDFERQTLTFHNHTINLKRLILFDCYIYPRKRIINWNCQKEEQKIITFFGKTTSTLARQMIS